MNIFLAGDYRAMIRAIVFLSEVYRSAAKPVHPIRPVYLYTTFHVSLPKRRQVNKTKNNSLSNFISPIFAPLSKFFTWLMLF